MAEKRKKATPPKRVATVKNEEYSQLEMYCIWLNEYYNGLITAGFKHDLALAIMMDKDSYPAWVDFRIPTDVDINKYLDEDED
jgi:hypothetical protein